MILVKKQGPYEVFSRGVEEPWLIWRDGRAYRQVWTWKEVEEILHERTPKKAHARKREDSVWQTRVFNTHHAAQGFLNRVKKRHVAVIEAHGPSQWRVAYLPEGEGLPLDDEVLREGASTRSSRGHATKRAKRRPGPPKLTARELEALDAIRLGDSYDQQIGEHLEKHGLVYWMGGALYITPEGRTALTRGVQ